MVLPGWLRSLKPMFSIVWKGLNPKTSTIQYYLHQLLQNPVDLYQLWSRALFKYKVWLILVGQLHTSYIVTISWFSRGMFSTFLSVINGSGIPLVKVKQTFSIFTLFFFCLFCLSDEIFVPWKFFSTDSISSSYSLKQQCESYCHFLLRLNVTFKLVGNSNKISKYRLMLYLNWH